MTDLANKNKTSPLVGKVTLSVGKIDVVSITGTGSLNIGETKVVRVIAASKNEGAPDGIIERSNEGT